MFSLECIIEFMLIMVWYNFNVYETAEDVPIDSGENYYTYQCVVNLNMWNSASF